MLFVTLGTNDKPFTRLLDAVSSCIEKGFIQDQVIVQSGYTKYENPKMEIHASYSREDFAKHLGEADIILTHGGVGTIMTALQQKKVIIGVPRLAKYHEHVNDHQIELLEAFGKEGYIIYAKDLEKLPEYLEEAKYFTPKMYTSNTTNLIDYLETWIQEH